MKINGNTTNLEQDLIMDRQVFDRFQNIRYLGAMINSKNLIIDGIKLRIAAANRYCTVQDKYLALEP